MSEDGNGKGTFWKIVGVLAIALMGWIGAQLLVIPAHGYQLQGHEQRLAAGEERISDIEIAQAQAKAATEELIALLKAEARERRARGR